MVLAFAIGALPVGSIWWATELRPVEWDVYYHLAVARDYAQGSWNHEALLCEGVLEELDVDREPLFHLALAGLLLLGLEPLVAAAVWASVVTGGVATVLYAHSRSLLVVLCGVFATNTFLFRLLMARPHGLALLCLLAAVALLIRGRHRSAAAVNLVYSLAYSVPVLILGAATLQAVLTRRWRGLGWVGGTSVLALVVHPQFPANVQLLWFQGFRVVENALRRNPAGVEMPEELLPWPLTDFAIDAWLPLLLLATALVRRETPAWVLVLQVGLLVLTLRSMRFIEYWAPLVCLTARPTIDYLVPREERVLRVAVVCLLLVVRPGFGYLAVRGEAIESAAEVVRYDGAAAWLSEHGRGERVFNLQWDAYPELRFHGRSFSVAQGMDPMFVAAVDPARYRDMQRAIGGELSPQEVFDTLGYRWIVAPRHSHLHSWPHRSEVSVPYEDERAVVFRIHPTNN